MTFCGALASALCRRRGFCVSTVKLYTKCKRSRACTFPCIHELSNVYLSFCMCWKLKSDDLRRQFVWYLSDAPPFPMYSWNSEHSRLFVHSRCWGNSWPVWFRYFFQECSSSRIWVRVVSSVAHHWTRALCGDRVLGFATAALCVLLLWCISIQEGR